jgi:hypothetical protein
MRLRLMIAFCLVLAMVQSLHADWCIEATPAVAA